MLIVMKVGTFIHNARLTNTRLVVHLKSATLFQWFKGNKMRSSITKHRYELFCAISFGIALLAAFSSVLPKYIGLVAPDSPPFFTFTHRTDVTIEMLSRGLFTPHYLYWLVFGGLRGHELTYIIDTILIALAGRYYLRSLHVHPLAAWFGGVVLALSGYTFTLFSAGHRGYFHMFAFALWGFGLVARCFDTRQLIYFALLGLVFAWGAPLQPDVLVLLGAVLAAYVVWRTVTDSAMQGCGRTGETGWGRHTLSVIRRVWPRFGVTVLVLTLAGFSGIREAVTVQITNRDAQIAGMPGSAKDAKSILETKKSPEEQRKRWLFATNWSLPPEDVLEFIVPGVFGNDSAQPPYPYWGRMGRPDTSVFLRGRMMPNYRQHTVYLGLVPLLFAFFSVLAWKGSRITNDTEIASGLRSPAADRPFWCGVWIVCLLLSFGRYAPLYRLFYAIPYMDYIRAPAKFLHMTEISTAFLAGFGMDVFLRTKQTALRRKLLWLAVGLTGMLLVGALVALTAKPTMVRHITVLGMGSYAEALGAYTIRNVMRAVVYAAVAACALFVAVRSLREGTRVGVACALICLALLDQSLVAQRYVRGIDLEHMYRKNAVVKALKTNAGGRVPSVVNYATQNAWGRDWFSSSLAFNGIRNLTPASEEMDTPYGNLFRGLQKDPLRLWQVLGAQAVIAPLKGIDGLVRAGALLPLLGFELGAGTVRQMQQPGEKTYVLAAVKTAVQGPRFLTIWDADIPAGKQVEALIVGRQDVADAPRIAGGTVASDAHVKVLAARGQPGVLSTRVQVHTAGPGLLVFDERIDERQEMLIDGKVVPKYVANAVWPAALVPAGEHEVVLRQKRQVVSLLASILTTLGISVWALLCLASRRRAYAAGVAT